MKTMKKLLVVLVALLLISSATVVAVFASDPTPGNLSVAGQYMSNITAATSATEKIAAIRAYDEYMDSHTFPTDSVSVLNYEIIVENATAAKVEFTKENIQRIKENVGYQAADDPAKETLAVANYENLMIAIENLYFMTESEEYRTFKAEFDEKMAKIKLLYDARIEADYTASFGEYEYPMANEYNFEPSEAGVVTQLTHGNLDKADPTKFKSEYRVEYGEGANGSMGYYYEQTLSRVGDPYPSVSGLASGSYPGFVIEFDYYHVPGATLSLSRGSISINGTTSTTTEYGAFTTTKYQPGYSGFSGGKPAAVEPAGGVLAENSWNRIAIALDAQTGTFKAYANYKFLASFMWTKPGEGVEFTPSSMRFKYSGNEMRLDNIRIYYGTQPRILDRFEKMTTEERFLMYSEVILDKTESFENRDGAYSWMNQNIGFFYDEFNETYVEGISDELKAAVDILLAFDYVEMKVTDHVGKVLDAQLPYEARLLAYDEIATYLESLDFIIYEMVDEVRVGKANVDKIGKDRVNVIKGVEDFLTVNRLDLWNAFLDENMQGLKAIYDAFCAIADNTFDTIDERNSKINEFSNYIITVTEEKLPQGKEMTDMLNAIEAAKLKIEFDNTVQTVRNALSSFATAPTFEAQKKWADRVESMIYIDGVSIFSDMTALKELAVMKTDYDSMATKMQEKTSENNAKKIVLGVRLYKEYIVNIFNEQIKAQTPVGELPKLMKLYELTSDKVFEYILKEKADEEAGLIAEATAWEYVRSYSLTVARAVKEGYNTAYEGVDEALAFNEKIYAYFYNLLQEEHIQHLTETLARYETAQTYVDKLGVCTYIENYIATQDIDTTRADVIVFIERVAEIRESLTAQNGTPSDVEVEYLEALKANTTLFIAAVNEMLDARDQGYQALYDAWQEALKYYYFMEITSNEVKAAIAEYVVLEQQLLD